MDERFSLYNIAEMLSEKTGIEQQDAEKFLDELIAVLNERIRSDHQVQVRGLGVFKIILVKERESVHVNTGERIVISEHHKLTFIPEKELKEMVNKPFSMFSPEQLPDRPSSESSLVTDMHYEDSESEEDTVTQPSQDEETSLIAPPSGVAPSPPPGEAQPQEDTILLPPPVQKNESPQSIPQERTDDDETSLVAPPQGVVPPPPPGEAQSQEDTILLPPPVQKNESHQSIPQERTDDNDETSLIAPPQGVVPPPPPGEAQPQEDTILLPPPVKENESPQSIPQERTDDDETSLVAPPQTVISPSPCVEESKRKDFNISDLNEKYVADMPKTRKKALWPLFVILGLLLLILGGGIWYLLSDEMVSFFNHNSSTIVRGESFALPGDSDAIKDAHEKARAAVLPDSASSGSDTTAVATSGSNPAAVTKISTPSSSAGKENTPETKKAKSVTPVTPKSSTSSGKDVKARVKMTEGQRLTLLSLKYYGNKIFWVYIYEYNKSRIGANPNRIPVGMEILIPENRIYDIDAGNEASVRKAQKRQDEIISGLN